MRPQIPFYPISKSRIEMLHNQTLAAELSRVRLPRDGEDTLPCAALGAHLTGRRRDELGDGQQAHLVVAQPHGEPGVPRHGPVHPFWPSCMQ